MALFAYHAKHEDKIDTKTTLLNMYQLFIDTKALFFKDLLMYLK